MSHVKNPLRIRKIGIGFGLMSVPMNPVKSLDAFHISVYFSLFLLDAGGVSSQAKLNW
jgi:hypothetical protein